MKPTSEESDSFEEDLIAYMSLPIATKANIHPECSCVCHEFSAMWNHQGRPCCDGAGICRNERG